jgi:hypothetical protein
MWTLVPTDEFKARYRHYEKKHPPELRAVLVNLETYREALEEGTNPLQVKFGFVHGEGHGVVAVDQKGRGGKRKQTRLYLYPDTENKVLYQLTLGDKNTQKKDVQFCHRYVARLKQKGRQTEDDPATGQEGKDGR